MEVIKDSIHELTQHFNTRMAEFQQNLNSSIPATSPNSHIAAQFSTFRTFVLTALESLQLQVQVLSKQHDSFEMRSRKKMLLIHGIAEDKGENVSAAVLRVLSQHLKIPDLSLEDISRCNRLGKNVTKKPRPIVIKFKNLLLKNKVWFSKTNLKSTGITLSEFLTKPRHETFVAARERFGISRCWTKNGYVVVTGSDGKQHSITSISELNNLFSDGVNQTVTSVPPGTTNELKAKHSQATRSKRIVKK